MLYIPKIEDYLKILTDEEVKYFEAINFGEYFKSIKEEENLRKVFKLLYIFLTTSVVINGAIWDNLDQNFQIFNH